MRRANMIARFCYTIDGEILGFGLTATDSVAVEQSEVDSLID